MRRRSPSSRTTANAGGSAGAEAFPLSNDGGRGRIRRTIQPGIAVPGSDPQEVPGSSCEIQLTDRDSFSWSAARFYLHEAVGLPWAEIEALRILEIQCTGNLMMCFVKFSNGMRVVVSFAQEPAFVIVRRTDSSGPRREYTFTCADDGRVVFQRRTPGPGGGP